MHARIQIYWCRSSIFRHLKLELLTQFPASKDEKYINVVYIWPKFVSFYGYVHWRMTTEISVMYGSEKVKLKLPMLFQASNDQNIFIVTKKKLFPIELFSLPRMYPNVFNRIYTVYTVCSLEKIPIGNFQKILYQMTLIRNGRCHISGRNYNYFYFICSNRIRHVKIKVHVFFIFFCVRV